MCMTHTDTAEFMSVFMCVCVCERHLLHNRERTTEIPEDHSHDMFLMIFTHSTEVMSARVIVVHAIGGVLE